VLDGDGRPVKSSLVEIWQANAAGGLLLTEHVTKMVAEHFGRSRHTTSWRPLPGAPLWSD
jgi:protocatechuate 3,4-dioxygenase beta subunit